jgi:hypothetical protein
MKQSEGHARSRRSRITGVLAPVTAATALLAVTASAGVSAYAAPTTASASGPTRISLRSVPPYYMSLVNIRNPNIYGPQKAEIRDTVTGAKLATVFPPKQDASFMSLTGAADDRTFVLSAEVGKWSPPSGPTKFFLARFDPADGHVTLTSLRVPEIPNADLLTGLALSPNGTELAMAVLTGKNRSVAQVSVYSVKTAARIRSWQSTGTIGYSLYDTNSISWSRTGTLAFNWFGNGTVVNGKPQLATDDGIWLLNTNKPSGGLLTHSRLAVRQPQPSGPGAYFSWDGVLTPYGNKIVVPVYWGAGSPSTASGFEEFSARTGRLTGILHEVSTTALGGNALEWTSSAGGVLVVGAPPKQGGKYVYGVLSGTRFIPLPKAPPVTSPELEIAF